MTLFFLLIALLVVCYVLSKSTDMLVTGVTRLSENTAFEKSGITALFVALGTSLPELFVSLAGALSGDASLALGVVIGSNIANITLVIGLSAAVAGSVKAIDQVYSKDILYSFLIGSLPLLLLIDKTLSRIDGVILIVIYMVYNFTTLTKKKRQQLDDVEHEFYDHQSVGHRVLSFLGRKDVEQGLGFLTIGSILLVVCAELIVSLAHSIAFELNAPMLLVGLFMVSVGTSLPELAFEVRSVGKKEYLMAFGNITGSTVVNSSLILGLASALSPITLIQSSSQTYMISVFAFVIFSTLFWLFTYSRRQIERWEGALMIALYFVFVMVQLKAGGTVGA